MSYVKRHIKLIHHGGVLVLCEAERRRLLSVKSHIAFIHHIAYIDTLEIKQAAIHQV